MISESASYTFNSKEISERISIDLIYALGAQPFGSNYLAPHTNTILHDSVFTEARDRSNANFLWFIKFERSFQEAEQELQPHEFINKSGIDQTINHKNKTEDTSNETNANERPESSGENVIHIAFGADSHQTIEGVSS